ncbi:hypothetical protein BGZ73_008263 [Actinomortierella ambigua]|nr:hypothetical protein BGZ73_008263 [Actinomortierella ambigua]
MSTNNPSQSLPVPEGILGNGGYGTVYKASRGLVKYAVKKFLVTYTVGRELIDNEITLHKRLNYHHIVQYYGHRIVEDEVYLFTAYAAGGSLQNAIKNRRLMSWDVKERITHEITLDLKSANVLLTKTLEVKLCDFGLATVKELCGAKGTNSRVGTNRWMAPELFKTPPEYSTKSDMYALGMVMWEMAAMCTVPFLDMKNNVDVASAVQSGKTEEIPPNTPSEYRRLIKDCWSMTPSERPTVEEVSSAFNTQSEQQPLDSSQLSATPTATPPVAPSHGRPPRIELPPMEFSSMDLFPSPSPPEPLPAEIPSSEAPSSEASSPEALPAETPHIVSDDILEDMDSFIQVLAQPIYRQTGTPCRQLRQWKATLGAILPKLFWKNGSKTFPWLRRSAKQGNVMAQYELAIMYHNGQGVPMSKRRAAKWFRRAAEQSHPGAQFYLGYLFDIGRGVHQSIDTAFDLYTQAAEQGHSGAQFRIGCMYLDGGGKIKKDVAMAVKWLQRAAEQNYPTAQHCLEAILNGNQGAGQTNESQVAQPTDQAEQGPLNNGDSQTPIVDDDGSGVGSGTSQATQATAGVREVQERPEPMSQDGRQDAARVVRLSTPTIEQALGEARASTSQSFQDSSGPNTPTLAARHISNAAEPRPPTPLSRPASQQLPALAQMAARYLEARQSTMIQVANSPLATGSWSAKDDAQNVEGGIELSQGVANQNH